MARMVSWFGIGLLSIAVLGCTDPPNKVNGVGGGGGGGGGGAPAAPAAPGPAMPGMPGAPGAPGAPGMGPMAPGHAAMTPGDPNAPGATAATTAPVRDLLAFLPSTLTYAVGGRPAAATQANNKVAASLLEQFGPLTNALAKIGLPPQEFESFWAGGNQDMSEQALCVVTKSDINVQALRLAMQAGNVAPEAKVWPLPGAAGATHTMALADSRTVIVGRKATVDAALRKTPSTIIKQGLASVNSPDADFWIAGDAAAAKTYLKGGFPLVGTFPQPIETLTGFGVAMTLEGRPQVANSNPGMMGMAGGMPPGMAPGAAMHSASPMPMPMPMVDPATAMHGAKGPGPMGQPPPQGPPPGPGEKVGILVVVALTFDSEPSASAVHVPLEEFLSSSWKRFSPKQGRFIPDLIGSAATNNANGPNAGAMMTAAPMKGMGPPGSPGSADSNGAQNVPKVAVILDTKPAGAPPPPNPGLTPIAPPQPAVLAAATPGNPAGAMPPGTAMPPGGPMPMGAFPMMTPGAPPAAFPGPMGPGMVGGPGMPNGSGPAWVHQQGPLLHFGYRFDARDQNIAVTGHLLRALGVAPQGSVLAAGPLADLHRAIQEFRAKGLDEARKARGGFGPQGTSWMVHLLPHLGHSGLYSKFNFSKPLTSEPNAGLTHAVIPEFLNPADSRQQWQGVPFAEMGLTHFVGVSGVEAESGAPAATLDRKDPKAGIFGYQDIATPEMITDGQSQTMMLIGGGRMASPWAIGGGATIRGIRPGSFNPQTGFGSVGGPKPGAFVLFADGSVRFVSADIDEKVLQSLSTTHGAETVDLPALQGSGAVLDKW